MARPPTPTGILKLSGGWRADRHGGRVEAPAAFPPAPSWLSERAAKHWPIIGGQLHDLGLMADLYTYSLSLLCDAFADWLDTCEQADAAPKTIVTEEGAKIHPLQKLKDSNHKRFLLSLREFGMTPITLAKMKTTAKPQFEGIVSRDRSLDSYKLGSNEPTTAG